MFGRIISAVVVGAVQNGLLFLDRVEEHQRAAVTEVLSQEIKTGGRHTNMEVLLSDHQKKQMTISVFCQTYL